jgi:hypothetical protein
VAVDTKTKQVVSLEVSDERTDDGKKLKSLVRGAKRRARVKKVLGDRAGAGAKAMPSIRL